MTTIGGPVNPFEECEKNKNSYTRLYKGNYKNITSHSRWIIAYILNFIFKTITFIQHNFPD